MDVYLWFQRPAGVVLSSSSTQVATNTARPTHYGNKVG